MMQSMFKTSEALHKVEGTKKIKTMSFHQYSWNSEVETTWISLIGWSQKTSNKYSVDLPKMPGTLCLLVKISEFEFGEKDRE